MDVSQELIDKANAMFDVALDRTLEQQMNGMLISKEPMREVVEFIWGEAYRRGLEDGGA